MSVFPNQSCDRVTLLELIAAQLGAPEEHQEPVILPRLAEFLVTYFVDHRMAVLELASGPIPADTVRPKWEGGSLWGRGMLHQANICHAI